MKKTLSIILSLLMVMQFAAVGFAAESDYTIVSPYEDVIWEGDGAWGAYKGTIHTHTTYSDASESLSVMVKEYYNQDYDFVGIADHGVTGVDWDEAPSHPALYLYQPIIGCEFEHLTTEEYKAIQDGSYPLVTGVARNKKMVPVLGANELNYIALTKNHVNGFFLPADKGKGFAGMENEFGYEQAIRYIEENGGLSHINHPGDWLGTNDNPDAVNDPENIKFFGDLLLKYDSCLGMEVFNEHNGTTGYDRILWDNLLMYCLPYGKNVIGFSNTDAHTISKVDSSYSIFMMKENTVENIKATMQSGSFFCITRELRANKTIGPKTEINVMNTDLPIPMFTSLTVDGHKISASAKEATRIQWIADGKIIKEYDVADQKNASFDDVLDLDAIEGAENFTYVRVELFGEGGICTSQALVIDNGSEPLEFVEEEKTFIDNIMLILKGTKIWALISEISKLIEG